MSFAKDTPRPLGGLFQGCLLGGALVLLACSEERPETSSRNGVHPLGISDPKSANFHATHLRARRWAPMLDKNDAESCGLCHDGVEAKPDGVRFPAPGAPSCTSCHEKGVLDCSTCHKERPESGAHTAHLALEGQAGGLVCASCHELPGPSVIAGNHGNGQVEVRFDPARIPAGASYEASSKSCAVYCHDHGGARARPSWDEPGPMRCGDCHGAPPDAHYPGACTTCHREANGEGNSLIEGPFHLNGKIDLGDGSGGCGACHRENPDSGAHVAHRSPTLTTPVACGECHPSYDSPQSPGHLDGVVHVSFGARAKAFGAAPSWSAGTCASVACHGAGLTQPPGVLPSWQDTSGAASQCGACHGVPPLQHTPSTDCGRSDCHGGVVQRQGGILSIPPDGRALHINGQLDINR